MHLLTQKTRTASVALKDIDGDGVIDWIFEGNLNEPNTLHAAQPLQPGNFSEVRAGDSLSQKRGDTGAVALCDLDSDGDVDVYAAYRSGDANELFLTGLSYRTPFSVLACASLRS